MGIFSAGMKRQPMFGGQDMPQGYMGGSGIGDGMIERQQMEMPQMGGYNQGAAMMGQPGFEGQAMPQKPKFFGDGGVGRAIAGNIGDFLLQNAGMNPMYNPEMQHERAMQQRTQQAEQEREAGWQDFVRRKTYERENDTQAPTAMERNLDVYSKWTPEQRSLYGEMNPIVQTLGDGSARAVNRYNPQAAPTNLGDNAPTIEGGYKYTPGAGGRGNSANWQPTGGSVGNGTANFR